uniref:Ig-like domain-containing protein n=1 Tax=Sinocyclocheilus grahami TaxID=75366 RepID=A0A672PJM9_SINGR
MFTWTLIYLCFIAHYDVSSGQDRVEQSSEEMTASEGAQVIVWCKYITTDTTPYLFWYQQLPNRSPTFILNKLTFGEGTTEPDFKKRFSATLNSTSKTVPLMIKDVRVSDSAVYYLTVTHSDSYKIKLRSTTIHCHHNKIDLQPRNDFHLYSLFSTEDRNNDVWVSR